MADSNQFKVGDVVRLKSDGPKMTVTFIAGEVTCVWFAFEGMQDSTVNVQQEVREFSFPADALAIEKKAK